jgi:hypothetical protein
MTVSFVKTSIVEATVHWTPHLLPDFGKIQYKKYEYNADKWVQVLGKSAQRRP